VATDDAPRGGVDTPLIALDDLLERKEVTPLGLSEEARFREVDRRL
jgi:hypothetical protein